MTTSPDGPTGNRMTAEVIAALLILAGATVAVATLFDLNTHAGLLGLAATITSIGVWLGSDRRGV